MAGLETLDEFSPRDTDPVSLGDDVIRETRQKTKTSFGIEHYLDGPHKVPGGAQSLRPAAGRKGRLYFNTDTKAAEYDTGSAWSTPGDAKAYATMLWHASQVQIPAGAVDYQIPFDSVLVDPGGYAFAQYQQIYQPDNSVGIVTAYLEFAEAIGGLGAVLAIQQFDHTGNAWANLVKAYSSTVQFLNVTTMVSSLWGQELRVVVTNATNHIMTLNPLLPLGNSPRFGYTMLGRII